MNSIIIFAASYLYILALAVAVVFFLVQPRKIQKNMVVCGVIVAPLAYLLSRIAAFFYYDPRPFVVGHFIPLIAHVADNGFPSDHVLLTGAVAAILWFYNKKLSGILWLLAVLIGAARVLAGVHHVTDIAGSVVIVLLAATVYEIIVRKRFRLHWPKIFRSKKEEERGLHDAFEIGVALKGLDGIAELIGGSLLLLFSSQTLQNIFLYFAHGELAEDPKDLIANYLLHLIQGLSIQTQSFYAWLFVVHGAIKVFLVAGLLRNKLWAYPSAIAAFSLFVIYQLYRLSLGYSWLLAAITVIDVIVIALTIHEYKEIRRRRRPA